MGVSQQTVVPARPGGRRSHHAEAVAAAARLQRSGAIMEAGRASGRGSGQTSDRIDGQNGAWSISLPELAACPNSSFLSMQKLLDRSQHWATEQAEAWTESSQDMVISAQMAVPAQPCQHSHDRSSSSAAKWRMTWDGQHGSRGCAADTRSLKLADGRCWGRRSAGCC